MGRADRVMSTTAVLALTLALGGCETSGVWDSANSASDKFQDMMSDFNPFGTSKKPLPGERREVFPGGVPGVQQGVPPELMKGHQQAEEAAAQPAPEPAAPKPKKTAKAKTQPPAQAAQAPAASQSADPPEDGVWPPPPKR
jgi:hypothetical protein